MAQLVGFILALIAGFAVRSPHRAGLWLAPPWLTVLGIQTWAIASGRTHSPAATTGHAGYWIVNAVTLALAIGVARQLAKRRRHPSIPSGQPVGKSMALGMLAATVVCAGLSVAYGLATQLAHPGHGDTPPIVLVGLLASATTLAVLAVTGHRRRRDDSASTAGLVVDPLSPGEPTPGHTALSLRWHGQVSVMERPDSGSNR